ncbi:MAG: GAF domain-containing protein [Chloroflexi bacterium]|nr:GAF domain-containing protein [Chloroflexota bacterium]
MNPAGRILLASARALELQPNIKTNIDPGAIDILTDETQLLAQLSQSGYQLLLVDLAWLQRPGAERLLVRIKMIAPQIEVILLARAAERSQAVAQLRDGAADYLLQPVGAAELSAKIERVLEFQALKAGSNHPSQSDSAENALLLLHQATQEISRTWQFDEALKIVLAKAHRLTHADVAKIYLTDPGGNLDRNKILNSPLFGQPEFPSPPDQAGVDDLLFSLTEEAAVTQEIIHRQQIEDQLIQAALLIPLISRDKLIGVLGLGSDNKEGLTANHRRWLSIFCDQAAIAIENARLFENLASAYIDLAQSREKILHSRNTLQVLFDGIADGLYILDQNLIITALNQVEAERQGHQPDELVGKSCLSLDWAQAAPELLDRIKESLATGRETTWISPENETEPYLKDREFRIYPIRNRIGHIEQVVVFGQDVSERRRWQASLFRSANLAAVGQLAGSVAHQINNPLTITMANSQLLLLETQSNGEAYELADGILKASTRIQKIIENLLEFSNQETYFFIETDLIETIEGALALVTRSLKKDKVELIKNYEVRPKVSASVSHLKLVWMNLLLNARDAVLGFTEQPVVAISTQAVSEREVKVAITDNGCGIAEKDFERLFRPFFTTKPVGKALGLGLYSAHAIIERHRGQINAYSQPGVSTTFEVILPLDNPRDL